MTLAGPFPPGKPETPALAALTASREAPAWDHVLDVRLPEAYVPHNPHPAQRAFLAASWLREILYGGAAGGGKSDAMLMAALQYVHVPAYSAILIRRNYSELSLPGALMSRAHEWLAGTDARWDNSTHTYRFPSGATLTFGYLRNRQDLDRYRSAEFQFIGIDELTEFEEYAYRFMFSRLRRRAGVPVPLRMRSASNPGGVGHDWVKARFIPDRAHPEARRRPFIPARLRDNPSLDAEAYVRSLASVDPVTRYRLLEGDWEIVEAGGFFQPAWFEVLPERPADKRIRWVRRWDLAATAPGAGNEDPDYTAGALVGFLDGQYWLADMQRARLTSEGVERLVAATAASDGRTVAIRLEQEPGSAGKALVAHYQRRVVPGYSVAGVASTGSKVLRAAPAASAAEAGNLKLIAGPWVLAFLHEAAMFPQKGFHDDQIDALAGAVADLTESRRAYSF